MIDLPHSAIILAGGLGTRLRAAVPDLPKPMAPVDSRPFLEHLMDYWIEQGITNFVLSVGYKHEMIANHFGKRYREADLDYSIETSPMGTGGGVLLALDKLRRDAPFLLLNGDTYFGVNLKTLCKFFYDRRADWAFSLFETNDTNRYMGMDILDDGRIQAFKKQAGSNESVHANGGVYLVNPASLQAIPRAPCSLENDVFPAVLKAETRLFGLAFSAPFIDIGVPEDYRQAATIIG